MKKIINILVVIILGANNNTQAQTYPTHVTDTLNYLHSIIANKQQFVGQPFSVLYDSLKIQIKYFYPFGAYHYDQSKETDTEFAFNYIENLEDFYLTYHSLNITWVQPLNLVLAHQIRQSFRTSGTAWGIRAYQHYANAIIKDISLVE